MALYPQELEGTLQWRETRRDTRAMARCVYTNASGLRRIHALVVKYLEIDYRDKFKNIRKGCQDLSSMYWMDPCTKGSQSPWNPSQGRKKKNGPLPTLRGNLMLPNQQFLTDGLPKCIRTLPYLRTHIKLGCSNTKKYKKSLLFGFSGSLPPYLWGLHDLPSYEFANSNQIRWLKSTQDRHIDLW